MTDPSAAATIEKMQEGAQTTVAIVQARLREAATCVEEGSFVEAMRRIQEAEVKLHNLAGAESGLAAMAEVYIVRAGDIGLGTDLRDLGEVTSRQEPCEHQITFGFEDGREFGPVNVDQELLVNKSEE